MEATTSPTATATTTKTASTANSTAPAPAPAPVQAPSSSPTQKQQKNAVAAMIIIHRRINQYQHPHQHHRLIDFPHRYYISGSLPRGVLFILDNIGVVWRVESVAGRTVPRGVESWDGNSWAHVKATVSVTWA